MNLSDRALHDLTGVIDARVDRRLATLPRTEYGSVDTVSGDGKTASVNLLGASAPSGGFRVSPAAPVLAGDYVRVTISPRGDRWISANLTADRGLQDLTHDHDADYSAIGHNHDGTYAPVHSHPYAATSHGHEGWVPITQSNVINGTTYSSDLTNSPTNAATGVPANGAAALTGRIYVTGTVGAKASLSNWNTGAQAGQAAVYTTAVEGVGFFVCEPGGTNGNQLLLTVRRNGGSVTVYVQVNGYIPAA